MQAAQEEVDTEEGEQQDGKTDDCHYGGTPSPQADGDSLMEKGGIQQPGYGGPDLLRIPGPERSPDRFCVYHAGDQAEGHLLDLAISLLNEYPDIRHLVIPFSGWPVSPFAGWPVCRLARWLV